MEINTPTEILEIRNVHVALQQPPEDFTQRSSKLSKLLRVTAYRRRFSITAGIPRPSNPSLCPHKILTRL
jgi:hypothetical protein